ncbi:MAG: class I SAM-dependent methyltransferase [Alphaproteobacteria bacterium]|nr:class I SAM-dependent methyltransferase [Alphaproteobacteria bacterium]
MSETERSTEGMVDYGKNSAMQQQLVNYHAERIRDLVQRLGLVQPELRIVDYGCGPGQSAIDAVAPAVEAYRARFADATVSVCHADQPGNDWNSLFQLISSPRGYAAPGIRTAAAIGSFYGQMVANNSVDLGTCFMASHWLSHAVHLDAPGSVWFGDLRGAARVELAARAQSDWKQFLQCRARELRSGGCLLVSCLGAVPQVGEINGQAASGRGVYRAMQKVAQELADEGWIKESVLDRFVFGVWFMTDDEARAPLETDPVLKQAFDIEDISVVPAPYNPTDVYADYIDDPDEYARLYVGYIRGFAHSALSTQLFTPGAKNGRDGPEIAAEFYRRLHEHYRSQPGKYAGENWYLTVVLRKT